MKRITQHLITTSIGAVIIFVGLGLIYLGKLNATEFTLVAGVGTALLFSKDDTLKPQL